MFFGLFHLHRIWALIDRTGYSDFWLGLLDNQGVLYVLLMGILAILCLGGMIVFIKNKGKRYWWRWIYLFGGGYVLFDLFAVLIHLEVWDRLLRMMFDTTSIYWNFLWGFFIMIGFLSFLLGIHIIKLMKQAKCAYRARKSSSASRLCQPENERLRRR